MSLTHFFYEPFYSQSDFDRLFDEALDAHQSHGRLRDRQLPARRGPTPRNSLRPRMDMHEDKEKNVVTATFELPGLKKGDVQIDVHNGVLTVSGETRTYDVEEDDYVVRERRFGRFSRSIPISQGVKEEEIKASLEDGVLSVTFPSSAPEAVPKKIVVA